MQYRMERNNALALIFSLHISVLASKAPAVYFRVYLGLYYALNYKI